MSKRKAIAEPSDQTDIEEIRKKLGLSVQEFALKVGVREYTVERWERNESKPSPLARRMISTLVGSSKPKGTDDGEKKSKK